MMTEPLDLEPIKARLAAVTPGRWVWVDHDGVQEEWLEVKDADGNPHEWSGRYGIEADPIFENDDDDPAWGPGGREVVMVLDMVEDEHDGMVYEIPINDADAALIVNAPSDIAALVDEVERLRAMVAELSSTR